MEYYMKLITFAHENNGMWPNAYLAEKIATLNYLKNGFNENEIINFRNEDIKDLIEKYPEIHSFEFGSRYFGYLWKPYLILRMFKDVIDNDIIIYSDVGSIVSGDIKNFLYEYLINDNNEFFYFYDFSKLFSQCKKDLYRQLNLNYNEFHEKYTITTFFLAVKKTNRMIFLFQKIFENMSKLENIDYINRIEKNDERFIYYIPDQSIFTLTLLKLGFEDIYKKNMILDPLFSKFNIKRHIHVPKHPGIITSFNDIFKILNFNENEKNIIMKMLINN